MTTLKLSFILAILLSLTACGDSGTPVALEKVKADLDESGVVRNLSQQDGQPLTLIEAVIQQGVSRVVATTAFSKYDEFKDRVTNSEWITMIDFTKHSGVRRFYMVNRATGKVDKIPVAHGTNSDPDKDGYAQYFSNVPNSRKSSLGSYIVAERYEGKHGGSLRTDGLESTNSNVRDRAIVIHAANYVREGKSKQGWSWGCPAVPFSWIERVISRLRDGSFMYAYGVNKAKELGQEVFWKEMTLQPGYRWVNESEEAPDDGELSAEELEE